MYHRNRARPAVEALESRTVCSAIPGWSLCFSGTIGPAGLNTCFGPGGASAGYSVGSTVYGESGWTLDWRGNRGTYLAGGAQGGFGPVLNGSASIATDRFGRQTFSTAGGAGFGVEVPFFGASITFQSTVSSAPFRF